jgi:hypothetical protein
MSQRRRRARQLRRSRPMLGLVAVLAPAAVPVVSWLWLDVVAPRCELSSPSGAGLIVIAFAGVAVTTRCVLRLTRSFEMALIAAIGTTVLLGMLEFVTLLLYAPATGCET